MSFMPMNQDEYGAPVMQDISQQRKLAQALLAQQDPLQGQNVSGIYVAPSWTQQLAQALKPITGAWLNNKADEKYKTYDDKRKSAMAELLKGNQAQTTQQGTTDTSTIPAYTPEQQDRFGSPLAGVQRQPVVTSTPNMVTETPEQVNERQQAKAMGLVGEYGMTPEVQLALNQLDHKQGRLEHQADVKDERGYQDTREEKLYNRNRTDKLTDTEAEHKYQEIVTKESQGFQLSMQDKQFAQQYKMQAQNQGFQAGQQSKQQAFTSKENALNRNATIENEKLKIAATTGKNKPLTEVQGKAALYGNRANDAHNVLNSLGGKYSPMAINAQESANNTPIIGGVVGAATNALMSSDSQKAQQAQRNFLTAILRQESGAAISPSEFDVAKKQYFPQTGDSDEVIAQKKANREEAINGFSKMSSGAFTPNYTDSGSIKNSNGLPTQDAIAAEIARRNKK